MPRPPRSLSKNTVSSPKVSGARNGSKDSRPGELVLYPFCGSGSGLVAARRCGRDFLGMELDQRHHLTASLRVHSTSP
ncbi:hypothetical protein DXT94_31195 [Rhizobium sp. ICMP 5592]|nr:hypothetical protein [Rhizobium sp. ICMP 5592]